MIQNITLIGAGNVAQALGKAWVAQGLRIVQVFSRDQAKAQALAQALRAEATDRLADIRPNADVYVIAVKDDAIAQVAAALAVHLPSQALVVHTSGATALSAVGQFFTHGGIFYPLQTFTVGKSVDWSGIPLFIQCPDARNSERLTQLAQTLSPHAPTILTSDEQRLALHVAAVLVNNFSNALFEAAQTVLQKADLPPNVLLPLFRETVEKLATLSPQTAQTGPASRGDTQTMAQHIAYLERYAPQYRALYVLFSDLIRRQHLG